MKAGPTLFERYGDPAAHLHVHDTRRHGDTNVPVGSGVVDYGRLGPALAAAPDATTIVGVFTDDERYLTRPAERLRRTLDAATERAWAPSNLSSLPAVSWCRPDTTRSPRF